jgi:Ca-activated chloride channel homolog
VKKLVQILLLLIISLAVKSQYYYRGDIVDEKNKPIANVNIYLHSTKVIVSAGSSGSFGVMSPKKPVDTFTLIAENYERTTVAVFLDKLNLIKLRLLTNAANIQKNKLATVTKNLKQEVNKSVLVSSETYSSLIENEFIDAQNYATTGFSINSDKASYSNIRRFLNMQSPVPTNAVRIDEMINYFNFNNKHPNDSTTFNVSTQVTQCPWNNNNYLLYASITAKKLNLDSVPPSNLIFLIDNSGSMELQNRMSLLKTSFKLLIKNLRTNDKITIITYGGIVTVLTDALTGNEQDSLLKIVDAIETGGDTPGENAINVAYQKVKQHFIVNGNNRVIIATDGDFNVGASEEAQLEKLIIAQSQSGIRLTCLGVGVGNYKDSKLEVLAKKGNGNFAYIDNELEGEKIMVKEMTQTLFSVADNAFVQIEFDKKYVNKYRLIGFDNKLNAITDSSSKLEGGQIGSAFSTLVLFEIEPTKLIDSDSFENVLDSNFSRIVISYTDTKVNKQATLKFDNKFNFKPLLSLPKQYGFATAVAMFGSYIKESKFLPKTIDLDIISSLANKSVDYSYATQTEFLELLQKARLIYEPNKKKKKRRIDAFK